MKLAERITEQVGVAPPPNCGPCPYRTQLLAVEGEPVREIAPGQRRAHPAFGDVPPPNCVMCKYRVEVLGFVAEPAANPRGSHYVALRGRRGGSAMASAAVNALAAGIGEGEG